MITVHVIPIQPHVVSYQYLGADVGEVHHTGQDRVELVPEKQNMPTVAWGTLTAVQDKQAASDTQPVESLYDGNEFYKSPQFNNIMLILMANSVSQGLQSITGVALHFNTVNCSYKFNRLTRFGVLLLEQRHQAVSVSLPFI